MQADQRDVLWLGAHKTGTTFLQRSLDLSRRALRDHDVTYVELDEFRRSWTVPLLYRRSDTKPAPRGPFASDARVRLVFDENIPGLVWHSLRAQGFYSEAERRSRTVADHLGLDVSDVVYGIRPYTSWIPSMYCEFLKGRDFWTFDAWMQRGFAADSDDVDRAEWPALDFDRADWPALVRRLGLEFPDATVRVYFADELRGREAELLGRLLDVPAEDFTLLTSDERRGFSAKAIAWLHNMSTEMNVTEHDIEQATMKWPRSRDNPGFSPWPDDVRAVLDEQWQRHREQLASMSNVEVIRLV